MTPSTSSAGRARRRTRTALLTVVLVFIGLIAAAALFIYIQITRDTIPLGPPSGELGYTSNANPTWDIYVLDTAGVARNLSAEGDFQDYFVSWAFDGERVNFISNRAGGLSAAQVNPDGTSLRGLSVVEAISATILDGRLDWDPAWSPPDSSGAARTVWASLRDFNLEIYVGDASAQNGVRLTNGPARDWFMSWSPDGAQIAFSSDRAGNEDVYVMNADGSGLTQLTTHEARDLHPVWSLDGEQILFVSERDGLLEEGILTPYVMNPDGSDQRPLGADDVFEGDPTYSADGQQIAYMSNEAGDWNIYVMNIDGSGVRRVTEGDADEMFPVWRPVPAEAG